MISPGFKDSLDRNAKSAMPMVKEGDNGHKPATDLWRAHLDLGYYGGLVLCHARC